MQGLYGRSYGTLTANVENLTPAAQGGGLQPLQLSRWTGTSKWASVSTWNTPPAPASPTVPFPGQPQYGLQQGPNYAPVIGYGSADYEVGYAGAGDFRIAGNIANWDGAGGWKYLFYLDSGKVIAQSATRAQEMVPGTYGYKAVLTEGKKIYEGAYTAADRANSPVTRAFTAWAQSAANMGAESLSPKILSSTLPPSTPPSTPQTPAPPTSVPGAGWTMAEKVAVGVLVASVVAGGAALVWRQRSKRRGA